MANIYVDGLGDINIPDDMPLENVNSYVEGLAKKQGIQLKPFGTESGTAGIGEAFVGGAKRLLSSQFTGLQTPFTGGTEAAKSGIERQRGITERPAADFSEVSRKYEEEGILPAAKELASQIPSALAEQAPFLAESFAGARTGAMAGALTPIPGGAIIGGAIGAFAPSFIAALGGNVERQAQEQIKKGAPVDVDTLKATGAAIPQGLLDVAEQRLVFGKAIVGKMLGLSEKEIAKSTEKSLEKQLRTLAEEGTISTLGKGTLRGIAAEVPTEIAQQALERWQAGLPLADKDALKEYGETAYGVALLGPLGAVGRFGEKGQAREELARRDALEEFERSTPDVASLSSATPSNLDSTRVNTEATNFLSQVDREKPFDINRIVELTGDDVAHEGDATAVANELLKRGEIVQDGGTEEAPQFRFLKDEERIAPHLNEQQSYLYASPVTRPTEEKTAEGYEVSNPGINVTRKAKTPEEAENIKTQMDARVKRNTDEIDNKIKDLQSTVKAIQDNLNVSIASNISDEELGTRYDEADVQFKAAQENIAALEEGRGRIAQETSVTPIGEQTKPESGYEVRLYRPGQSAKTLVPFANREQAEQFILQNATPEQKQAIFEDQAPHRESLRETQKKMYMPGEATPEATTETATEAAPEAAGEAVEQTAPQPTPEMQQRVQAVTSRLRGALDQMGLQNVGVNVSNKLTDMVNGKITPIDGMYLNRIVNVSLSSSRGVFPTFGHETIHAMREMGMFSDKEWDVLSRKAKSEWIEKYGTKEQYEHLNPEEQIEEAIADAFGFWMGGEYKPTGVIRGLLNRIKLFLESVGSVFRGQGFDNTEKIFTRATRGKLKGGAERTAEGKKYAVSMEDYENLSSEGQRVMAEDFLYSPLNRMIANAPKKLDGQPAAGWRQWLKANEAQAGGSKGEIYWTGLEEWLINHGKERVSQKQIAEYLKQFDAPRDVVYESSGRPDIGVIDVTDQLPEMVDPMGDPVDAAYELLVNIGGNDFSFVAYERKEDRPYSFHLYDVNNEFVDSFRDIEDVKEELAYEANESLGAQGSTKFSEWTLDGGDNYREIPVVLSGPAAKKVDFDFYGTHWPDANVIYHLRTNDRQDIDGNNVLFVEEVQSDWAQKGREEGFVDPELVAAAKQKRLPHGWEVVSRTIPAAPGGQEEKVWFVINEEKVQVGLYKESPEEAIKESLDRLMSGKGQGVPRGPYVEDTSKWVDLAAKRIIAMAVSGGYDKVAFINPDQAHKRFPKKKDGGSTKEGFENFYGKILPNKLNSLLQKYGGKVEVMQLPVIGDADKWATDGEISQQLGFVVTPELAASVRQKGFPKHALPMNKVLAQGERRSVTDAEGKQIHPTKDGIRNFWRWFGDGQLKDDQGRPRVFYHASLKDIEKFKQGTADAIFFAPNSGPMMTFINYKVNQEKMAEKKAAYGTVYPVYINAKNVFDYENPEHVDALVNQVMQGAKFSLIGAMKKAILHPYYSIKTPVEGGVEEEFFVAPESIAEPLKFSKEGLREKMAMGWWPIFETGEVINAIKKLGFDAFHVQENFGGRFYKNVAVFSPNQIKSAVGNNGLFEPQDPRIQHALSMPKTKVINSINAASKPFNKRQDPLFATPFISPQAGIGVLNQAIRNTPTRSGFTQKIKDVGLNLGGKLHDFFQLSGLADLYGDDMPIRPYYESIRKMMGARDVYIHESTEISEEWQRLNARSLKDGNNMATVMNRATFYRYDPSKDPGNKNQRAPRTAEEIEIQRMFDALPKPYKELYVKVRNFYRSRFEDFFKKLEDRVKASVKDPKRAQHVIEQLKKQYNYYNQIEPYFPLTRFGEYWVRYTENGQMKFEMFENAADQNSFRTKIMSNPQITDIKYGVKLSSLQGELGASDFVKSIMDSLDQAKGGFMGQAQIEDLKDSVWQLYLSNLPELSVRKQFLHRSNVPGYSNDALRAFQKNAFHGAYHMARLEFAPETYKKLNDIRQFVSNLENTNHPDAVRLGEVFNSISSEQRQKQIWRPDDTTAPFRILGQLGFLYYLSTAASAVTNLSQNFTHTFPILGAEYGYDRATKELARSYKQFFESPSFDDFSDVTKSKSKTESFLHADKGLRSIFDITRTLEQLRNEAQTPAEKDKYTREIEAINHLYQTVISRSQAMDLAGATDRVTMSGNWFQVGMRFVAMAFHGAEVVNRTTTGLVAYRLEMEKLAKEKPGLSIDERQQMAVQKAAEIVDQAHFNYSEANRSPLFGQTGNLGKVIFMFKSYAIAETTFLFNAFRVWSRVLRARWKGTPLEQKAIDDSCKAKRMLLGVMGMQALFSGALGLPTPLMMIVMGLANMMGGDDDDEDKDLPSEVRFKKWLVETFGENAAQAIAYGPMSYLTGADFNSRVGLNTLWFRDPNPAEDELDQTRDYLIQLGGPIAGGVENIVKGVVLMNQGEVMRGVERASPNIVKAPLQWWRFQKEGATTVKGDVILDELTTPEKAMAFLGFTPFRLALEYKQQSDTRGAMFKANLEKKRILLRFNMAAKSGDSDGIDEIGDDIAKYNIKYPGDPITYDTLSRSLKSTAAAERETVHGLRIPKKQRGIAEGVSWLEED